MWPSNPGAIGAAGAVALTRIIARAIFLAMRRIGPSTLIARALFVALLGFFFASGSAFAHSAFTPSALAHPAVILGGVPVGDWPSEEVEATAAQSSRDAELTKALTSQAAFGQADASSAPCSDDQPGGLHHAGSCCNVACHAALAAPIVESAGVGDPAGRDIASLSDMLVGRPHDRTERPPRHG